MFLLRPLRGPNRSMIPRDLLAHRGNNAETFAENTPKTIAKEPWCPGPESNRHALRRGILSPLLEYRHQARLQRWARLACATLSSPVAPVVMRSKLRGAASAPVFAAWMVELGGLQRRGHRPMRPSRRRGVDGIPPRLLAWPHSPCPRLAGFVFDGRDDGSCREWSRNQHKA